MDENDVRKHIRNKFLVTALAVSSPRAVNSETAFAASCRTAPGNSVYFLSTRSSLASASPKPRSDTFIHVMTELSQRADVSATCTGIVSPAFNVVLSNLTVSGLSGHPRGQNAIR